MRTNLLSLALVSLTLVGLARAQAARSQAGETTQLGATVPSSSALAPSTSEMREAPQPFERGSGAARESATLAPTLPPVPAVKATLVGGTLEKLDPVRDELTVRPFGGGRMKILFDPRTRIYRDGKVTSGAELKTGDRVYVDTILTGTTIFASSIRFNTNSPQGESQGSVMSYHPEPAELWLRDALSPEPLRVRVTSSTRFLLGSRTVSASELEPGTLVSVKFDSDKEGGGVAREVSVLAMPGSNFTFAGQVVAVNLRTGLLVLTSETDRKTYEIYFDPSVVSVEDTLHQGADVTVLTRFDGTRYTAQNLTVNSPAKP